MLAFVRNKAIQAYELAHRAWFASQANAAAISPYEQFIPWRVGPAANAPVLVEGGPTQGWQFAVGKFLYGECPLVPRVDTTQPLDFELNWAPLAPEVAKTVTWQLDFGFYKAGSILTTISHTETAANLALSGTTGTYQTVTIALAAAVWAADPTIDEVHVRLSRNNTAANPVTDPGVHHLEFTQRLVTG